MLYDAHTKYNIILVLLYELLWYWNVYAGISRKQSLIIQCRRHSNGTMDLAGSRMQIMEQLGLVVEKKIASSRSPNVESCSVHRPASPRYERT